MRRVIQSVALSAAVLGGSGCGFFRSEVTQPRPGVTPSLPAALPLRDLDAALRRIPGSRPPAWHRFTVEHEGHEVTAVSLDGIGGTFVALFRDGALDWIARWPRSQKYQGQSRADSAEFEAWALAYNRDGTTGDHVVRVWREGWEHAEHWDPSMTVLWVLFESFGRDGSGERHRFARTRETLDPTRFAIGMPIDRALAVLPRAGDVSEGPAGREYRFGEPARGEYLPAAQLVLTARDGVLVHAESWYELMGSGNENIAAKRP
jgi:hypothetical protein